MKSIDHDHLAAVWEAYRNNPARHLTAITRYAERTLLARLNARGYERLSVSFTQPVSLLALRPLRLTELAALQGISKQLCLQQLKPMEQGGYITRSDDPDDRRAKRLQLTERGMAMVGDAVTELQMLEDEFETLLGPAAQQALAQAVTAAARAMDDPSLRSRDDPQATPPMISAYIGALTRSLHQKLMGESIARGHRSLQLSFGQVLTGVDLRGTRVNDLASACGVTNQAIFRIVRELEALGYIDRFIDSGDRRSKKICFTARGLELIADSVAGMISVEEELSTLIGDEAMAELRQHSEALYQRLGLEHDLVGDYDAATVEQLLRGASQPPPPQQPQLPELLLLAAALGDGDKLTETAPGSDAIRFRRDTLETLAEISIDPAALQQVLSAQFGRRDWQRLQQMLRLLLPKR